MINNQEDPIKIVVNYPSKEDGIKKYQTSAKIENIRFVREKMVNDPDSSFRERKCSDLSEKSFEAQRDIIKSYLQDKGTNYKPIRCFTQSTDSIRTEKCSKHETLLLPATIRAQYSEERDDPKVIKHWMIVELDYNQ
jgi:hypothetical protein